MRKMKKINGYLVVKFNARELREYEGTALGEYGVIDAELYTGNLDVDRGAMEYDNAGSMEEAVELARGLESELDAEEPEVKVTIVKETDETTEEEEVDAQQMIAGWETVLRGQVENPHYKGVISFATNTALWDAWERIFTDLENPKHKEDAEDFFKANEAEMLEGTAVLWEEKLPYYALMVMRVSEGEASFSSEIQNEPIDPENCAFAEEWFDFYDDGQLPPDFSDPKFLFVAANDPSLGKNRKSDTSAIIGIAKDTSTGYMYVVIADIAKRKPDKIIEDAIEASRRLKREYKKPLYKFGVETVQFQYYFAEIMRQKSAEIGEYLPIEEINSVQNKDARIQSLQPFVKNGYLKFSKRHKALLDQMLKYPMGKNDDTPDALQMAVALALSVKVGRRPDYKSVLGRAIKFRRGAY